MPLVIPSPEGAPLFGWDWDSVKDYVVQKPLEAGDQMIIHNSHAGLETYQLADVHAVNSGHQKRVILSRAGYSGGLSFHRSGRSCFHARGQTRMIPPIQALMEHLTAHNEVQLDTMYGIPPKDRR